jgi:PLP dependent protein
MKLRENLKNLLAQVPADVKTVVVSKNRSVNDIMEVYNMGYRMFGENKAQELLMKQPVLPSDIEWHFIGHLQTNKVRPIAAFIDTIQSVDSYKLLQMIDKEASRHNRTIKCLLQFHIASEETKFGLDIDEAKKLAESYSEKKLSTIKISGVMGMASYSDDENLVRKEFNNLITYYHILKSDFFADDEDFREISMGMSGDYQLAIQQGSTMIRLGTAIFGERDQD